MAAEKKNETTADNRVEVFIPKGNTNDEPSLFVGVNGVGYLLPKGKASKVPPEIAAEVRRAVRAGEKQDQKIDELLGASN